MVPPHLLLLLTQAEAGNEDAIEQLDELLTVGDLENIEMKHIICVRLVPCL